MSRFLLVVLFPSIIVGQEVVCPQDSLNAGWTVRLSYAFSDPSRCCENEVSQWFVSGEADFLSQETGCLMEINLVSSPILKQIFPVLCSLDSDCGETASSGVQMECCPERYCLAKASNGSSLCHANFNDDEVITFERPRNEIEEMKHQCRLQGLDSCLTCQSACPPGSQVKADYMTFRNKRQTVSGASTNVVSTSNLNPAANDFNTFLDDSEVTSLSSPRMPSEAPFLWSRKSGNSFPSVDISLSGQPSHPEYVSDSSQTSYNNQASKPNLGYGNHLVSYQNSQSNGFNKPSQENTGYLVHTAL